MALKPLRRAVYAAVLGPLCLALLASLGCVSLVREATAGTAARATLPLTYADACPAHADDPVRISVDAGPKGPVLRYARRGRAVLETPDVNLAFVSRRLFFTLRAADELIEFQGRAGDDALTGTLVDGRGAHQIAMPRATAMAKTTRPACPEAGQEPPLPHLLEEKK